MKKIFARSPYIFEINEPTQVETKLELYLWKSTDSMPTTPTYTFTNLIPSLDDRATYYDISNQSLDFIENINPDYTTLTEDGNMWAYGYIKKYYRTTPTGSYTALTDEYFTVLNGYTEYMDGVNFSVDVPVLPLASDIKVINSTTLLNNPTSQTIPIKLLSDKYPYINVLIEKQVGHTYWVEYVGNGEPTYGHQLICVNPIELQKVFLNDIYNMYEYHNPYQVRILDVSTTTEEIWSRTIVPDYISKYTPILCSFINKFGGWENIWFMRANVQSIAVTNVQYNLAPQTYTYNPLLGQRQTFNSNGTKSIKVNTGWVEESLFDSLITELSLSDTILLDNVPVNLKTKNSTLKTHLKDKNINYTLDFDYKFKLINNIV